MIKVAVIGAGMMGLNHVRWYSEIENVELVGVSDVSETNLKNSEKYTKNLYKDYKEMIEKEKPDMVSLVVPTKLHTDIALYLIQKKINLLIEKPIADTVENAEKIIEEAKKNNIKLMIGHIERFNPAIQELKNEIQRGKLGKPFRISVERIGPFPSRIRDVGVVIDLAVHDIDIIRYVLGEEIERIFAETSSNIHTTNEDVLDATLRTENGVICNLNINWLTPTKKRKFTVTGEKGMFVANYEKRTLYLYENDVINEDAEQISEIKEGKMIRYNTPKDDLLKKELLHFIDCVENDKIPLTSGEDGLMAIKIAHEILKSAKEHRVVKCLNN